MKAYILPAAISATILALLLASIGLAQSCTSLEFYQPGQKANPDLAITITWNTTSDVDLWVTEPDGTRCFYQMPMTKSGGQLHEDNTTGFGPERYSISKAPPGEFVICVNHFRVAGPTTVKIEVIRYGGTPRQTSQRHRVNLQGNGQTIEVCRMRF
jgi:uncharacterized protein YfaP (DUF2135 family)